MSDPAVIEPENVPIGTTWHPEYTLQDVNGNPLDISAATVKVIMRLLRIGSGTALTKSSAVSGEAVKTNGGADGVIKFLWEVDDTTDFEEGDYEVDITYEDTAPSPDVRFLHGHGQMTAYVPLTGTLPVLP